MELNPIYPFEPISSDIVPTGPEWISQIKWDGVRILTYFDGTEVKLFNRKLNDRTNIFPELTNIKTYTTAQSIILDGEVIALDQNGNPSFHEVMRRDGIRRMDRIDSAIQAVPIFYMIFDILFYNGEWVTPLPLQQRQNLLFEAIQPNQQIQLVPNHTDGVGLFEVAKQHNLEGIVCKNLNSKYLINGKHNAWQKVKNYKDVIAVIGGVTYRSGIVNSILVGLYNEEHQLVFIGHVGTGKLTKTEWKDLTTVIDTIKIENNPFSSQPKRIKEIQWIEPLLTVKVQFIEWTEGHSLRQPSIQAFIEKDPKECTLTD
ncbi:non-homologous end-joining DNA ligase [Bacillus sp. AFS055030]|uniref:non-homologous end-joining DNA ligase n=1 Tax=Bacillus sp. AFS055030 TaxID=2033507 RepID=UPI000BFC5FC5|nr:non-homologous end-joining DNA ligase [Bacillus sp. AFS055030]PGL69059.1 DNA ligase [Bacillus sp. AFS055030]